MPLRSAGFAILVSLVCATLGSAASGGPAADEARRADYARPASVPYPESNPFSQEKADLGRALFFEPRLSAAGTMACATCHKPERAWSDGLAPSQSSQTALMSLHPPSLLDIAWLDRLGWEGRYRDIEAVTFVPILSTTKMNMTEQKLIAFLSADPAYAAMFASAFPGEPIGRRPIEMALATFERSITSGTAPFDRWIAGDGSALSSAAKRGFALFSGKAHCSECHSGWSFTDGSFHDIGVARNEDRGRGALFPSSLQLQHAFKTPTLRGVAKRASFMHDGSLGSLKEVIDLYDRGGIERPSRAKTAGPLGLSPGEKADLIAFLQSLSDGESAEN